MKSSCSGLAANQTVRVDQPRKCVLNPFSPFSVVAYNPAVNILDNVCIFVHPVSILIMSCACSSLYVDEKVEGTCSVSASQDYPPA